MNPKPILIIMVVVSLSGCSTLSPPADAPEARSAGEFESPAGLPTGVVRIGDHAFNVEIAATARSRAQGLMDRQTLARNAGMLFVYDYPQTASFWMLNTPLPLEVAFIREDLSIASIRAMEPFSTETHSSPEPVHYALELNTGELSRRGIAPGDTVVVSVID
jgi:uncharacterized membrane protein (UPF0127 family)